MMKWTKIAWLALRREIELTGRAAVEGIGGLLLLALFAWLALTFEAR